MQSTFKNNAYGIINGHYAYIDSNVNRFVLTLFLISPCKDEEKSSYESESLAS